MLSGAKSLVVPNTAIVQTTEREYVIAVKDNRASLVDIKEGMADKNFTEVFGSLSASDSIVLNPGEDLKQGELID
jgi:hypothetical protein